MQLSPYVAEVQAQLRAAAALGDDATRRVADALSAAAEPATRLAVLAAVTAAADELTAALLDSADAPRVSVRLDGDELHIEVRVAEPARETPPDDAEATARISLRLSEALKSQVEAAARSDAVSVNTWLVRAAARSLGTNRAPGGQTRASGHRITGWVNG
ncbi:MAG TPA: toxin-antitoxin system HicB family antitoxin [Jatrophihabitans sp.]|jgi:uncharacterized protein (DUF1778 family)